MNADQKEISIEIESIGAGGDGIGRCGGKPVYVAKTAPGDVVRARLERENADGFTARLMAVERPGPDRVEAPCPHFGRCGGCALQHVGGDYYRKWKLEKVEAALSRAGVAAEHREKPVFLPAASRRRTTLAAFKNGAQIRLGYNEARSKNIMDINACPVLEPGLAETAQGLRPFLADLLPERRAVDIMLQQAGGLDMVLTGPLREKKADFSLAQLEAFNAMAAALNISRISYRQTEFAAPEPVLNRREIRKRFGAITVSLPPGAFLQASAGGEQALTRIVSAYAADSKNIADLFSGCGTFAGALLEGGAKVVAIDADAAASAALGAAKHPCLEVERRNLFKSPLPASSLDGFDAAVFDPPRAGAKEQAQQLAASNTPRVIAVSCNPASFARDARTLQDGGYALKSLTLVDQFVWSAHVEIAALFMR